MLCAHSRVESKKIHKNTTKESGRDKRQTKIENEQKMQPNNININTASPSQNGFLINFGAFYGVFP